ncbi:MAG TPA: LytTR family DNA-binding domain-containing protein [Phaeodactylibacter sp.]|nr:LytTR family DNA-binding domain-containing protein [Phaeodactylibacter sp.]
MIRAIAIDDEPKALSVLQAHAKRLDLLQLERVFTDPLQGLSYLEKNGVELLFLDIQMPGIAGFELLKALPHPPAVVFTTAHRDYAWQSYELDAVDYLLKPFDFERFRTAVDKAVQRLQQKPPVFLMLQSGKEIHRMPVHELLYVVGEGNYVRYVGEREQVLVRSSITQAKEQLADKGFMQVHRSYLVALNKIRRIEPKAVYVREYEIPISATYKSAFLEHIQRL